MTENSATYKLSRFCFPIKSDEKCYVYISRTNNFYSISPELYGLLTADDFDISALEPGLDELREKKILTTEEEDDAFVDDLRFNHWLKAYNTANVGLTILPTMTCNLRCPYCFEETKPRGVMDSDTVKSLVDFVCGHKDAKTYTITWFGGEPLIGLKQMEEILDRLAENDSLELRYHSLVTNATLLDERARDLFRRYPLNHLQITLDGDREGHDKKRFFANGDGTFDLILKNMVDFNNEFPQVPVSIRINVDRNNSDIYESVVAYVKERTGVNVTCYPGILRRTASCSDDSFFGVGDLIKFNRKVNSGNVTLYPKGEPKGCTATLASAYVIGPRGEIYKCWEHVGEPEYVVGNIKEDGFSNDRLVKKLVLNGHPFGDERCLKCGFLPICSGGCPNNRVMTKYKNNSDRDDQLCCLYSRNEGAVLNDFLAAYAEIILKK